jgi:outer membrane protein OmpA-like peptidoglycan-associated protein
MFTHRDVAVVRTFAAFCVALSLVGCASFKPGRTTVILMPDEDGHVGAVSVASAGGARNLDAAFSEITVTTAATPPAPMHALGRASVEKDYEDLLRAQPLKPRTFTLNFLLDSTALTEESRALFPIVLQAAREGRPTEITVFGHADASGTEQHNTRLSADRARLVASLLRKADPTIEDIDVQWFGDRAPLVRSETREPRNRRVEIQIL